LEWEILTMKFKMMLLLGVLVMLATVTVQASITTCEEAFALGVDPALVGLSCPANPVTPTETETPSETGGEPSPNPNEILPSNNGYQNNGTGLNGQSWAALGGPAFTAHPFVQDDGTVRIVNALDGQFVTCDGSIFTSESKRCVGLDGSYIEYNPQTGKCYFQGVQAPDGKLAAAPIEVTCPLPLNPSTNDNGEDGNNTSPQDALNNNLSIQLGDSAPAPRVGNLISRNISGCPLLDSPGGNVLPFTFAGQAKDIGQSADGTSLLVIISEGAAGAWVDIESCPQAF
jgi:hypothetical protein